MFAVIPEEAVRDPPDQLLGSFGDVFIREAFVLHYLVHAVDQYLGAICEVLQRVHSHRGAPVDAAEDEPLVGNDGADEPLVARQQREDVGDEVRDSVLA